MKLNGKNNPSQLEKSDIYLEFPESLPVSGQRERIMAALTQSQVIIVCGETGSGKTTQLPKICLQMGRGRANGTGKLIGHTQPRRIAATSTAKRIAQELKSTIGQHVGYQVRFSDKTSSTASIKLMTDGILLAETQHDPLLMAYDTIIIDEAHERSLNIDFLLGYLRQILPKRPDLKIIITSATIDASLFAEHFKTQSHAAPIIEVSGRLFPVEIRYQPLQDISVKKNREKESKELNEAVVDAIGELWGQGVQGAGDILVFLPGEREIRDCAEAIRKDHVLNQRFHPEVLSLFARQSVAEQERVFSMNHGRRIVLATNVAETSLTVPGIRFVVDAGLARVKRYSYRNKVEQLQIEAISQAAANQRAGRCGRVADGICIRLYSQEDFQSRPAYSDPEILRSSLAAVILRMASLHLGRINDFPFIQAPLGRAISDGVQLLEELGAIESVQTDLGREVQLTPLGKEMASLPLDPRVGRMLLAAKENIAVREVLIICTALACQDPKDRPLEYAQAADNAHKQFAHEQSEFLSFVKLWDWYQEELTHQHSQRKLDQLCKSKFISMRRMREWRDVHGQLHRLLTEQGWKENTLAATYEQVHVSLLTGLLGNLGKKSEDEGVFEGARGIKISLWPGSTIGKKVGAWFVAAELVETHRLFARTLAKIEPTWVERIAQHRLIRTWSEPFWDSRPGEIMAHEQGSLYGLPIYHGRKIRFSPQNPEEARQLFIQRALVEGALFGNADTHQAQKEWGQTFSFYWHNQQLIKQIEKLEHQSRRQDVLVDDTILFEFYNHHLPDSVLSRITLQDWLKKDKGHIEAIKLNKTDLMRHEAAGVTLDRYPKVLHMAGSELSLTYHFEPGSPKDGVTLMVPLAILNQIDARRCEWLVPGLCEEKIHLYLKSLPQKLRRHCVPLPQFAKNFVDHLLNSERFGVGDLLDELMLYIREQTQIVIHRSDFRPENIPPHALMNFRLLDEHGRHLELDRNLSRLRTQYSQQAREIFQESAAEIIPQMMTSSLNQSSHEMLITGGGEKIAPVVTLESNPISEWSFGELPEMLEIRRGKQKLFGYPALVDHQSFCEIEVFDDVRMARQLHFLGVRRLFAIALKDTIKALQKQLPGLRECGLLFMSIGSTDKLAQQILNLALERSCLFLPLPNDPKVFNERIQAAKGKLSLIAQEITRHVLASLQAFHDVHKKIPQARTINQEAYHDINKQLEGLIYEEFLAKTPYEQLVHIPRYIKGIILRIDKLRTNLVRDQESQKEWHELARGWQKLLQAQRTEGQLEESRLMDFRWQLEELRIALYAQELKTPVPMSVKRLQKILESMRT